MSLIRYTTPQSNWSPFGGLGALRHEINRLFDLPSVGDEGFGGWAPALDVHEDKDKLAVSVELPGLKKDDIDIALHDGILTVSGERKQERETNEGDVFRSERYFGKFSRSISLPVPVDAGKVKAVYKDGVLTIELPKAEEAKPKRIEVAVS